MNDDEGDKGGETHGESGFCLSSHLSSSELAPPPSRDERVGGDTEVREPREVGEVVLRE